MSPLELERGTFQAQNLALLDFENGCGPDGTEEMHTTLTGSVASRDRDFVGLRFTLGVPPNKNSIDLSRAAPPLDVTGMFWTWQVGYKYVKLDGSSPASGGGINPFFLHLGASASPGDNPQAPPSADCAQPNLATFELLEFSPTAQRVVADLASLLASSDLSSNTEGTGPGCMPEPNDPECLTLLPAWASTMANSRSSSPLSNPARSRTLGGRWRALAPSALLLSLAGCAAESSPEPEIYRWNLPSGFPEPKVPVENPMTLEKAELGRHLFYDKRLSLNGTQSCSSCHEQALAFSDGLAGAVGSTGVINRRSSMSLANAAYNSAQTWANPLPKRWKSR